MYTHEYLFNFNSSDQIFFYFVFFYFFYSILFSLSLFLRNLIYNIIHFKTCILILKLECNVLLTYFSYAFANKIKQTIFSIVLKNKNEKL